ncbi:unnamed protein product, partial [Rotaria magnacalcarata]
WKFYSFIHSVSVNNGPLNTTTNTNVHLDGGMDSEQDIGVIGKGKSQHYFILS